MSLVLVVSPSRVDRLVVSRMVQAIGLKVNARHPDEAGQVLEQEEPCMIVVDSGAMDDGCAKLLQQAAALRESSPHGMPFVVSLGDDGVPADAPAPDAVVAKPIIGDVLQHQVSRLIDQARG